MKLGGTAWKFSQQDISTDLIRGKAYSHLPPKEQGAHCLEEVDPAFAAKAQAGDFIVAGKNFGCGSSTAAHVAVIGLGIGAVIAESLGKLFITNAASAGLWAVTCPGIIDFVNAGDKLELDTANWQLRNVTTGKTMAAKPMPDFLREMIESGGEKNYLRARLAREASV
jgi:3-isopropylmalate/(R)-2-methylmalate dehydratase small subunit